ncbi:LLM class flavin-dependent oxidoreductase [Knoellia locipacati]|uniref:LLM class flavin-dependent oxidoreductase n=1 Tax=Knoellia locipacati TaxID=882824 RepID=UPI0038515ACF
MTGIPVLVNLARPRGEVDAVEVARAVRRASLSGVGLADSPRLYADPLIETTRVLAADPDVLAGPCVLSLPLIGPIRAASTLGTLADSFPGRLTAVVGRGESSLANEGIRPPGLDAYAGMLGALRQHVSARSPSMTLLGAASGPRTTEVTARELGGVLLDVGVDGAGIAEAIARARSANPRVVVWAFVRMAIADDAAEADAAAAPLLGSCAARMAAAPDWFGVDADTAESLAALAKLHDYRRHGTARALDPAELSGSAGLGPAAQLVRERFVLAGSEAVLEERFRALAATGVAGLVLAGALPGVVTRLPELGRAARVIVGSRDTSGVTHP